MSSLKIDMSKVYDRVEWDFIRAMLTMGSPVFLIELIMTCISTVTYSITHRDGKFDKIMPQRGLRQGDPISPYLFIICAEGLSVRIQDRVATGLLHGRKITPSAPVISPLLFANDSLFFFKSTLAEATVLKNIFCLYEMGSGQKINFTKWSIVFSPNVDENTRQEISSCLGVNVVDGHGLCLGLPSFIGKSKKSVYDYIVKRAHKKVQAWKRKHLSQGGKEILLKSVAQALPNYAMQVFLLPSHTIANLEKIFSNFWWGSSLHWMRWERLC